MKCVEKEIQPSNDHVDTTRIGNLNNFEKSFNDPYKYRFLSILDDKIIGSWHLNVLDV